MQDNSTNSPLVTLEHKLNYSALEIFGFKFVLLFYVSLLVTVGQLLYKSTSYDSCLGVWQGMGWYC